MTKKKQSNEFHHLFRKRARLPYAKKAKKKKPNKQDSANSEWMHEMAAAAKMTQAIRVSKILSCVFSVCLYLNPHTYAHLN